LISKRRKRAPKLRRGNQDGTVANERKNIDAAFEHELEGKESRGSRQKIGVGQNVVEVPDNFVPRGRDTMPHSEHAAEISGNS
jgi:hypothetical protein